MPRGIRGFQKGNTFGVRGRPKGLMDKRAKSKERLREIFVEKAMERWEKIVEAQMRDSLKLWKARHYTIDQTIGKPIERVEIEDVTLKVDV